MTVFVAATGWDKTLAIATVVLAGATVVLSFG